MTGEIKSSKTWDELFLESAKLYSSKSKDTTKIGCVVVKNNRPISVGFNGIPSGVLDLPERYVRPEKYKWVAHSERNAIDNAAQFGIALAGSTIYVTGHPCNECAKSIISAGIKKVVHSPMVFVGHDTFNFGLAAQMFKEAGVEVVSYGEDNE